MNLLRSHVTSTVLHGSRLRPLLRGGVIPGSPLTSAVPHESRLGPLLGGGILWSPVASLVTNYMYTHVHVVQDLYGGGSFM